MSKLRITLTGRDEAATELKGPTVIGRSDACDLIIHDDEISRRHCQVEPSSAGWVLIDLGSRNGSLVNGKRVARQYLREGDILKLGTITLVVDGEEATDAVGTDDVESNTISSTEPSLDDGALPVSSAITAGETHRLPLDDQPPEIAAMLRELAPNPSDYVTFVAEDEPITEPKEETQLISSPVASPPQTTGVSAHGATLVGKSSWAHILDPEPVTPAKTKSRKRKNKRTGQLAKRESTGPGILERFKASLGSGGSTANASSWKQKATSVPALAGFAMLIVLGMGYEVYDSLFSKPGPPDVAKIQRVGRPHRPSDD